MPKLLIAVGGSGQHVALAVARLMFIRALPRDISCIVIDADTSNGLATKLMNMDGYVSADKGFEHPLRGAEGFLAPYNAASLQNTAGTSSFRSLLLSGFSERIDEQLSEALFLKADADQDITHGFFARPCLGSTAFAAHSKKLLDAVDAATKVSDRVFVTGSFIGGTGAGVIPSLIQSLGNPERWFGMFLLNWLNPPRSGTVTLDDMTSNMDHGLDFFYRRIRPKLKAATLLGPPKAHDSAVTRSRDPVTDGETPAIYHVLAARAMHHMNSRADQEKWNSTVLSFFHNTEQENAVLSEEWSEGATLKQRLNVALQAARLMRFFVTEKKKYQDYFGLFTSSDVPKRLRSVPDLVKKHCQPKPEDGKDGFVELLCLEFEHRAQLLERTIKYFTDIWGEKLSSELKQTSTDPFKHLRAIWDTDWSTPGKKTPEGVAHDFAEVLMDDLLRAKIE